MRVLILSSLFPQPFRPSEGTFTHRWAQQLMMAGCSVLGFTVRALTPATLLRSPSTFFHHLAQPRQFHYQWRGVPISGIRVLLPFPGGAQSRTQPHLLFRALRQALDPLLRDHPHDLIWLGQGGPIAQATARYARERNVPYLASAIGGAVNNALKNPGGVLYEHERNTFLGSAGVICVSEDMNRKVQKLTGGRCKTTTFYSGVDTQQLKKKPALRAQFRKQHGWSDEHTVMLFIGHLIRAKGIYELLHIFANLQPHHPGLRLLLVGMAIEKRPILKTIANRGIASHVTLTGGVDHQQVDGYLNAADLFVFPSWSEGLPNVVMEACALGLPVVASDVDGIPELIDPGKTGLLVPPRNEKKLEEAVVSLLASSPLRTRLGSAARTKMEREFNFHRNGFHLVQTMAAALDNHDPRRNHSA